ncbi:MAG: DUF2183 domain-containing protein [Acidimicrobiia bacterium]|nr:DUF2183 domain-containing protein [Acidimicrobiia bacterium]
MDDSVRTSDIDQAEPPQPADSPDAESGRGWRSQPRQVVGWALDRASGWGPVPEVASAVRQVAGWVRPTGPLRIDGYRSFGSNTAVRIKGRVLAGRAPGAAQEGEHQLRAAGRMATRFLSAEVADVVVEVCYDGVTGSTVSDDEGYFGIDFAFDRPSTSGARWSMAQARVLHDEYGAGQWWPIEVLVVGSDIDRLIISDVDDTILLNGVGAAARTVLTTISGSELTREAVPNAAEVYQQLSHPTGAGAQNPVFYVSSSPWNLYDFLIAFLDVNRFPPGPLVLRDIGLNRRTLSGSSHHNHKVDSINEILAAVSEPQVVLIGDTSLKDAHAFAEIIDQHPERVVAAFLRDVDDEERSGRTRSYVEEYNADRDDRSQAILHVVSDMVEILELLGDPGESF